MGILTAAILVLAGAQDVDITITGQLRHQRELEGGVWTLRVDGTTYDLHGLPADAKDGERVEIRGTLQRDRVCFHMVGPVLRVRSLRRVL